MYLKFAWRYFRGKKSANAINIIAWLSVVIIAVATCAQVLVLSVFNGFEGLVKSLYSSFYSDIKIIPTNGKTFLLNAENVQSLKANSYVANFSCIAEEKALIKNDETQTVVTLKGVDENYKNVSGLFNKITAGKYELGNAEKPMLVIGVGVQAASSIQVNDALPTSEITIILPKKTTSTNVEDAMTEGNGKAAGVYSIQQDIDNKYAITNIDFVKQQMGFAANEYAAIEIKWKPKIDIEKATIALKNSIPKNTIIQTRYQQNANLYSTMRLEKWAVYILLTLIIIIASFNIISALTMLVLEKQKDIEILRSMGCSNGYIKKIFLTEGILLGFIGTLFGVVIALLICVVQLKFHLIKLNGGSFLLDYFPVQLIWTDFLLVAITSIIIAFVAAYFPASKAAKTTIGLK